MPITELENNSESVWVKVFVNKTSHYVANWYRQPNGTSEDLSCSEISLTISGTNIKVKTSVHVLGDFKDIDWPDRQTQQTRRGTESVRYTL